MGSNIFILISGYFMVDSKFKTKRLLRLVFATSFYSVLIFIVFSLLGSAEFSVSALLKNIFPIFSGKYWFMTFFVAIYVISGYLNTLINVLSRRRFQILLAIMALSMSVIPNITNRKTYFYEMLWFIFIYCLGAYIKRYPLKFFDRTWISGVIAVLSFTVIFLFSRYCAVFADFDPVKKYYMTFLTEINSVPLVICAVSLLLLFKNIKIKSSKIINTAAASTLGVYLIHENEYIRPFLWDNIVNASYFWESPYLWLHALACTLIIWLSCVIIDFTRINTVERLLFKLIDPVCDKIDRSFEDAAS